MVCAGLVPVELSARSLPGSLAYTVYYLNGSSTAHVGQFYLPECKATGLAAGGDGSAQYLRLTNADTGTIINEQGALNLAPAGSTPTLHWNTSSHATLDPTCTGLYKCSTDQVESPQTYRLNVVGMCSMTVYIADRVRKLGIGIPFVTTTGLQPNAGMGYDN